MTLLELSLLTFIAINIAFVMFRSRLAVLLLAADRAYRRQFPHQTRSYPPPTIENAIFFLYWGGLINTVASLLLILAIWLFAVDKLFGFR